MKLLTIMFWIQAVALSFFSFAVMSNEEVTIIPAHLMECYKHPMPALLPMTPETLIEIVRKIDISTMPAVSLAQQIADLLYWFSLDGLERDPNAVAKDVIIPFHRTGFQALRQDLLFEKLIPVKKRPFGAYGLSVLEKCTLHAMLSASVDPWERGDEEITCKTPEGEFRNSDNVKKNSPSFSSCPVEGGAVLTTSGTVSVGRVLMGLLAALHCQEVPLSQLLEPDAPHSRVDNYWAATLAGDLAEVAVLQADQYNMDVQIGISSEWNDTHIPTRLFFSSIPYSVIEKRSWQITDSEILGGIDGLLLGMNAMYWKSEMPDMRLSQLLDFYYLETRIKEGNHVCKRKSAFNEYIRYNEDTLMNQTKNFAILLSTKAVSYFIKRDILEARSVKTVEKFMRYYPNILTVGQCVDQPVVPRVNLISVFDTTWTSYAVLQFLMSLTQTVDISHYGGKIAVLNGESTDIRVNSTPSISYLYEKMTNHSGNEDRRSLVLQNSLIGVKKIMEDENIKEYNLQNYRRARQDVVVVMAHSSTLSDKDFNTSKEILRSIKCQDPGIQFIYLASPVNGLRFESLFAVNGSLVIDTSVLIEEPDVDVVLSEMRQSMISARNLKPAYCMNDPRVWPEAVYYEFISPEEVLSYWIHPDHLIKCLEIVKVTFKNFEYGELKVCMSRSAEEQGECKHVRVSQEVTHALLRPCEDQGQSSEGEGCLPIYFKVYVVKTFNKCTEYDCRFEDKVQFNIIVQDLHCINLNSYTCAAATTDFLHQYFIILFILIVMYL